MSDLAKAFRPNTEDQRMLNALIQHKGGTFSSVLREAIRCLYREVFGREGKK